jgi:hypothetical protein
MRRYHKNDGQDPYHAVCTLSAILPVACHPVVAVIVQIETVNRRFLILEAKEECHIVSTADPLWP